MVTCCGRFVQLTRQAARLVCALLTGHTYRLLVRDMNFAVTFPAQRDCRAWQKARIPGGPSDPNCVPERCSCRSSIVSSRQICCKHPSSGCTVGSRNSRVKQWGDYWYEKRKNPGYPRRLAFLRREPGTVTYPWQRPKLPSSDSARVGIVIGLVGTDLTARSRPGGTRYVHTYKLAAALAPTCRTYPRLD